MKRLAVIIVLHILLILGLAIGNLVSSDLKMSVGNFLLKKDVLVMFGFGIGAVWVLAVYDVVSAYGSFRRRRELQQTIDRLEGEILSAKRGQHDCEK